MWVLRIFERLAGPRSGRTSIGLALSAGLLALCLTVLYLAMRNVMEVGGTCASGGPYEIATPCPKGVGWMMFVGIFGGMVSALAVALTAGRGPKLWALAWPALFLSLGWNFLDFGLDPPEPGRGVEPGWLVCAATFGLMGGAPLLGILRWGPRAVFWGDETEGEEAEGRAVVVALTYVAIGIGIWAGTWVVANHS